MNVRVDCRNSELGKWEVATGEPHPRLRDYLLGYIGFRGELRLRLERHLPSGEPAIVVNFGALFRVIDPRHPADSTWHRNVSVIGVHARHFVTETPGPKHCLVARLNPMGAHLLLRMPMNELVNRWVELDDIVSNTANRWREQLDAAETWHARFVLMDSLLLASFADRRATSPGLGWAGTNSRKPAAN